MSTLDLKCFCAAAEEMNITRAAERLHLTQQALSSKIARLEEHYHVQLFERTPKLRLSCAGSCFLEYARAALAQETALMARLADIAGHKIGTLAVGITPTRSQTFLPLVLPRFSRAFPGIRLDIDIRSCAVLERRLLNGDLDLIVCLQQKDLSDDVEQLKIMDDELCLVIPRALLKRAGFAREKFAAPARLEEEILSSGVLRKLPYVLSGPHARSIAMKFFRAHVPEPNIRLDLYNTETLFTLPMAELGAIFLFRSMAERFTKDGPGGALSSAVILPLGLAEASHRLIVGYDKRRPVSWTMKSFIGAVREVFPQTAADDAP